MFGPNSPRTGGGSGVLDLRVIRQQEPLGSRAGWRNRDGGRSWELPPRPRLSGPPEAELRNWRSRTSSGPDLFKLEERAGAFVFHLVSVGGGIGEDGPYVLWLWRLVE
jgi:hypothetical protein